MCLQAHAELLGPTQGGLQAGRSEEPAGGLPSRSRARMSPACLRGRAWREGLGSGRGWGRRAPLLLAPQWALLDGGG